MKKKPAPSLHVAPATPEPNNRICGPETARKDNRPPDWRWRYAATLLRSGKQPLDDDDVWVHRAYEFRRDGCGFLATSTPAPGLMEAFSLFTSGDLLLRWIVEARFVAKQSVKEVAAATKISEVTLTAFAKVFYDLAGPKGDYPAVHANVVRPLVLRNTGIEDLERALKLHAFRGGPHVLNQVIKYFTTMPPAVSPEAEEVDADVLEDWLWRLRVRLAIHMDALPASQITQLLPLQRLIERIEGRLVAMGRLSSQKTQSGALAGG